MGGPEQLLHPSYIFKALEVLLGRANERTAFLYDFIAGPSATADRHEFL
jgi:hypothetical protein